MNDFNINTDMAIFNSEDFGFDGSGGRGGAGKVLLAGAGLMATLAVAPLLAPAALVLGLRHVMKD